MNDGFYNPGSGIGTSADVGNWGTPYEPTLIGPYEASSMYSSGGLTQIIIDKKSRGLTISGYKFVGNNIDKEKLVILRDYAESLGFGNIICQAVRDGLLFGGSSIYPIFKGDNAATTSMNFKQLMNSKLLKKDCIDYFVEVDRWNMTTVPEYNLSAKDYMNPKTFLVPISGIEVNADRASYIKPRPLPYWSAIRQLGWGACDISAWAKSLIGYEIMAMSLPIMFQQMSLLVHTLPLDGIIAQNGVNAAKKWQKENEKELRDWSILNPKAINSFGEINVLNRNFSGFDSLINAVYKDIASKSGLPESVLFYTSQKGIFSKGEDDIFLKQSETLKLLQQIVQLQLQKIIPIIAISCFGCKSQKELDEYRSIRISFDTPIVSNPKDKAEVALKMSQAIQLLQVSGYSNKKAVELISRFIGENDTFGDMSAFINDEPDDEKSDTQEIEEMKNENKRIIPIDKNTGSKA